MVRGIILNNRLEGHSSPAADVTSARAVNIFDDEIKQTKEDKKMKHKIKTQFVLCFLTKSDVVVSVGFDTVDDMTLEVFGTFDSKFEALQELQTHEASGLKFAIIETFEVVEV